MAWLYVLCAVFVLFLLRDRIGCGGGADTDSYGGYGFGPNDNESIFDNDRNSPSQSHLPQNIYYSNEQNDIFSHNDDD